MKIYTRKGDTGETSLFGGMRVKKFAERIEAYGTIDELNAALGLLHSVAEMQPRRAFLQQVQQNLFTLGAWLAADPSAENLYLPELPDTAVAELETSIDSMDEELEPLKNFVLPGGHTGNAYAHMARTICRRAERRVVALSEVEDVPPATITYLNRLSDWLFTLARWLSKQADVPEVLWKTRG